MIRIYIKVSPQKYGEVLWIKSFILPADVEPCIMALLPMDTFLIISLFIRHMAIEYQLPKYYCIQ